MRSKKSWDHVYFSFLGPLNESYMQIESQILSSGKLVSTVPTEMNSQAYKIDLEEMR